MRRVLLDENLPVQLRHWLDGVEAVTVEHMGWKATRNGELEYRATTAQWHAERAARRPKPAKLVTRPALRAYVQDRLAGAVVAPDGVGVAGPAVPWKGRRHGPRQPRRWAKA